MEERYEIRGKIAQGGLGSVYKAHDTRMSRDVAIKRILTSDSESSATEEATRQLIKEASALASLQHPNIVTIYDVGKDEDGPFVVMELLTGQTLEEIISNASFTWEDFRQLAMQSLEALIAAQELHIIHRDIKPGNIMLTWLPSGKFQVKVVDFGLAKLSTKPSLQTIDQSDGVFGSIYFMGPEQFERIPIDHRVDLYALGSVFYYALTGTYAFDGENAAEVMAAHLQHQVTPIEEIRAGIPLWACNWIMWLINRQPSDRPDSARDALHVFMQNDSAHHSPELSTGEITPPAPAEPSKRPKLIIPGAATTPKIVEETKPLQSLKKTASISKALTPPEGSKPSIHSTSQTYQNPEPPAPEPKPVATPPAPPQIQSAVLSKAPVTPTLARPAPTASVSTSLPLKPILIDSATSPTPTSPASNLVRSTPGISLAKKTNTNKNLTETSSSAEQVAPVPAPKKGISNSVKVMLAIVLTIVMTFLILFILNRNKQNADIALFNQMILLASKESTTEVPVDNYKLELLLTTASSPTGQEDRSALYNALALAKAVDETDVDAKISKYVTKQDMYKEIRVALFREVIARRKSSSPVYSLVAFAKSSAEPLTALAAIDACRPLATETHFQTFLDLLKESTNDPMRKAAENNLEAIISKSKSSNLLRTSLVSTYTNSPNDEVKHATLRLLARVGGDQALEFVKKGLSSPERKTKIAALGALGNWVDNGGFKILIEYVATESDPANHALGFDAAVKYATLTQDKPQEAWKQIAEQAKSQEDEMKLINALAGYSADPWVFEIMNHIVTTSSHSPSVDRAKKAIAYLEKMKKAKGDQTKEK